MVPIETRTALSQRKPRGPRKMGIVLNKYLKAEAKRLRREADAMERKDAALYASVIRIYRYDAVKLDEELAGNPEPMSLADKLEARARERLEYEDPYGHERNRRW